MPHWIGASHPKRGRWTISRFLLGSVLLVVALAPVIAGWVALGRRLLPRWTGAPAALPPIVGVLTTVLLVIEALGIVGWYSVVPLVLLLALVGAGLIYLASRVHVRTTHAEPLEVAPPRLGRLADAAAVVAGAVFAAGWGARTYGSWNHGMVSIDTLWYHMPTAARFAQEGSVTGVFHDFKDLSGFYPVASEMFHSFGLVIFDNDVLSPGLNLGWGVLALLAAWCIGRPFGLAPVSFTGAAVLLCTPGFLTTQPAGAHSDVVGVALLLTTAALLVTANPRRLTTDAIVIALAAAPIGIALSTKWTLIPVSAAFTLGVLVLLARGTRLKLGALWLAIVGGIGCFSYIRNLVVADNPLPSLDLKIGPIGWDATVPELVGSAAVVEHVTSRSAWSDWLLPGLSQWYGYAWWAIPTLIGLGLALSLVFGPGRVLRLFAFVGIVSGLGYLFQPQLLELQGDPYFFVSNLRYSGVAMTLGLVLLPLLSLFHRRWFAWVPLGGYLVLLAVTQLDSAIWPVDLRELRMENPVVGADAWSGLVIGLVVLVAGLALVMRRTPPPTPAADVTPVELADDGPPADLRDESASAADLGDEREVAAVPPPWSRRTLVASGVALVLIVVGLTGFQAWYEARRYTSPLSATPYLGNHWYSWEWARDQQFERIGFKYTNLYYPLMGNDQSNHVDYIGLPPGSPNVVMVKPTPEMAITCVDLKNAINKKNFTKVIIYGYIAPLPPDYDGDPPITEDFVPDVVWLEDDPATSVELRKPLEVVFSIDGELDPELCPPTLPAP